MYIRDKRERTGNEKSAPPRERKTTNKKKTKKNEREREREREREGGSGRHRLESRGFKIILPFFCCLSVVVFMWETRSVFVHVQLLRVLVLLYYYLGTTNTILQIYSSFNHSSRWTLAYSSTTGIPFTNGWFNKTEYHPSNGAAPKEETQKHECEAGSKFSHLDWLVK